MQNPNNLVILVASPNGQPKWVKWPTLVVNPSVDIANVLNPILKFKGGEK